MSTISASITKSLKSKASKERAKVMINFFKTGKGQYGEGDVFYGVSVPDQRAIAKKYHTQVDQEAIVELLHSAIHEERLTAVIMMTLLFEADYKKGDAKKWVDLYLKQTKRINNWDLVDTSAYKILGKWLEDKDRKVLYKLAASSNLWENRIAVVSTLHFIKRKDFTDLLKLSKLLLSHEHDLMHKAIGWMLREAWKVNSMPIEEFLDQYAHKMPRTMLRYSIEKMTDSKKKYYMNYKK
jgi:3-methyladenine DNA glycosylase AlkD